MSTEKYTSLHSGLIARKGEALPFSHSNLEMLEAQTPVAPAPEFRSGPVNCDMSPDTVKPARPERLAEDSKGVGMKALTFRIDPSLYHRVQVAAAKLGWTSQDLLRAAVEGHLMQLSTDIFPKCGCIGGKDGCS